MFVSIVTHSCLQDNCCLPDVQKHAQQNSRNYTVQRVLFWGDGTCLAYFTRKVLSCRFLGTSLTFHPLFSLVGTGKSTPLVQSNDGNPVNPLFCKLMCNYFSQNMFSCMFDFIVFKLPCHISMK